MQWFRLIAVAERYYQGHKDLSLRRRWGMLRLRIMLAAMPVTHQEFSLLIAILSLNNR
jgi:hypothetical protein